MTENACISSTDPDPDHFHQSELRMSDVEARRNCMTSIQLILIALAPHPSHSMPFMGFMFTRFI
jgi:hypothetical protein